MQYLGSEIGEFGSFVECQRTHRRCILHYSRIIVVQSVYVCPYLHFFRINGGPYQRSRIVASPSLQIVYLIECIPAYKTLSDIDASIARAEHSGYVFPYIVYVRLAQPVGAHKVERRQESRIIALFQHIVIDHLGGDKFPLSQNNLLLIERKDVFHERTEIIEMLLYDFPAFLPIFIGGVKFLHMPDINGLQPVYHFRSFPQSLVIQTFRNLHQFVGRSRHGREHHYLAFTVSNEPHHLFHTRGRAYGGPAEFQYFHFPYI